MEYSGTCLSDPLSYFPARLTPVRQAPRVKTGRSSGANNLIMNDIKAPSQGVWGSPPPRGFGGCPLSGGLGVAPSQGVGGHPLPEGWG